MILLMKLPTPALCADVLNHLERFGLTRDNTVPVRTYQRVEAQDVYMYVALEAEPSIEAVAALHAEIADQHQGAQCVLLDPLLICEGASAGHEIFWHCVVETDVQPEAEADFNDWYDREHLPGLAAVPGTVRAQRYRTLFGQPAYYAAYDLRTQDTLGSPAWLKVRGTDWSSRVRPKFMNTGRSMFRRIDTPV